MQQTDLTLDVVEMVAGVDEAGRGPLAGPVVAAAVILDPAAPVAGLRDSKQLSERRREELAREIKSHARAWAIALAEPDEIDAINILQASMQAMARAVSALRIPPDKILVDGNRCPPVACAAEAIVGGDRLIESISAASILAKVHRDRLMIAMEERFPGYGFARHKGYPTKVHIEALQRLGPCPEHRRSFGPVRACVMVNGDVR